MKRISISKDYLIFSFIAIVVVSIIYSILISYTFKQYQKKLNLELENTAILINQTLTSNFNNINNINVLVGAQIAKFDATNLEQIYAIFNDTKYHSVRNSRLFSWSLFDWVDKNNLQTVNSKNGVAKDPPDMSHRDYTVLAPKNPWCLSLSRPAIGNPSGEWVIPVGTGITNKKDEFLGTIVVGINIRELTLELLRKTGPNVNFLVVDQYGHIVLDSDKNSFNRRSLEFLDNKQAGKDIIFNGSKYNYHLSSEKYPYQIYLGYNKLYLKHELASFFFPRITEYFILCFFILSLLFFFRKNLINPITRLSDIADFIVKNAANVPAMPTKLPSLELKSLAKAIENLKEAKLKLEKSNKTLSKTKNELEHYIDISEANEKSRKSLTKQIDYITKEALQGVKDGIDLMSDTLKGKNNIKIDKKSQIEILSLLQQELSYLIDFSSGSVIKETIDSNEIIEYCLDLNRKLIEQKKLKINKDFSKKLPKFYADKTKIILIFDSIINKIAFHLKDNEPLNIDSIHGTHASGEIIKITITANFKPATLELVNNNELSLNSIKTLLILHDATLDLNRIRKQTVLTIKIPIKTEQKHTNVVKLFS